MAYYLSKEREEDITGSYRRYQNYLQKNKDRFPEGAFELGTSHWWQLAHDQRCPHDGRLESFSMNETPNPSEPETTIHTIRIRLDSGYHDGQIELFYPRVFRSQIQTPSSGLGLGDWLYDEFTLPPNDHVVHEIEWRGVQFDEGTNWIIEASDVEFQWIPK